MLTIPSELLWQLAGYRNATTPLSTDQYTTGFFDIPYSSSFVHEMLGSTPESSLSPQIEVSQSTSPAETYLHTLNGSSKVSSHSYKGFPPNQTMGMVGTDPPTFNFEANLLGIIESRFRWFSKWFRLGESRTEVLAFSLQVIHQHQLPDNLVQIDNNTCHMQISYHSAQSAGWVLSWRYITSSGAHSQSFSLLCNRSGIDVWYMRLL